MNPEFKRRWIQRINTSSDSKCRLFLLRLKQQNINIPFTTRQKFVYALCKERLRYLAQRNNKDKSITKLPRADKTDVNWTSPKSINSKAFQEYLFTKEKRNNKTR